MYEIWWVMHLQYVIGVIFGLCDHFAAQNRAIRVFWTCVFLRKSLYGGVWWKINFLVVRSRLWADRVHTSKGRSGMLLVVMFRIFSFFSPKTRFLDPFWRWTNVDSKQKSGIHSKITLYRHFEPLLANFCQGCMSEIWLVIHLQYVVGVIFGLCDHFAAKIVR